MGVHNNSRLITHKIVNCFYGCYAFSLQ